MKNPRFRSAVFLQFMGTVGSGIFVLPYLFDRSNFLFAIIFFVFLTIITAALNHFYVDIVTATQGDHQLTGYSQIYLGPKFKLVTTLNLLLLAFGAIIAYSKLFSGFFTLLLPSFSSYATALYLFLVFISFYFRQKLNHNLFLFIPIFILLIPIILFFISLHSSFVISHLSFVINPNFSFFGATLFALSGFTIIPEVRELLGTNKRLSQAVLYGLLLSAVIYCLYAFSIIRLSGSFLSVDSVTGLAITYPFLAKSIAFFGLIITLRASFGFLIILRELFYRDLKLSVKFSEILPLLFPLLAVLLTSVSLLTVISLTGDITIFISALIICLIRLRLPHTFITQIFSLLIMISLLFGLVISFLN